MYQLADQVGRLNPGEYRKFRTISRDFFRALSTLQLIQWHDLCSNSVFFFLKLPGKVLGAAYNQVRLIVRNLRYISPKLMFPSNTLPGGTWHSFILGRIWGAIRGLGEILSSIFGILIVGRLIWYVVKVLMNCSHIHSVHGCSAKLAWSFCTEVFFSRNYQREQRQQGAMSGRYDNDPSSHPKQTMRDRITSVANWGCLNSLWL